MTGVLWAAAFLFFPALVETARADPPQWGSDPAGAPVIGGNPYAVRDWSRDHPFTDLIVSARPFGPPDAPWEEPVPVDADGWPVSDFGAIVLTDQTGAPAMGGVYTVDFEGTAAVVEPRYSPGVVTSHTYDASSGRTTVEIDVPDGLEQLMLRFTGTSGGVRDLRVLRPGASTTAPSQFDAAYRSHHARFSLLRFLDFTDANSNVQRDWSDRTLPDYARQAHYDVSFPDGRSGPVGAAFELTTSLCNELSSDLWLNVPHLATDDFVTSLAELVRDTLDPTLAVYIEYSNETWNTIFVQYDEILALAQASVAAGDPLSLDYDGQAAGDRLVWRYTAARIVRIAEIFRAVFSETGSPERVRPVLAGFVRRPTVLRDQLAYVAAAHGAPANHLYAAAGGPYLLASVGPGTTAGEILDELEGIVEDMRPGCELADTPPTALRPDPCEYAADLRSHAALARYHGLAYLAYEGGPDLEAGGGGTPAAPAAQRAASLDPRMGGITTGLLTAWYQWGFGEFAFYQSGATNFDRRWFGLTDAFLNQTGPKLAAVDAFAASPLPQVTAGEPVPGLVDARRDAFRSPDWENAGSVLLGAGDERDYLVRAPWAGFFRLGIRASAGPDSDVEVWLNGQREGSIAVPGTGFADLTSSGNLPLRLTRGLNVIRLRGLAGSLTLDALDVRRPPGCGMGFELALGLPWLALAAGRRTRRCRRRPSRAAALSPSAGRSAFDRARRRAVARAGRSPRR